ncbi:MAG: hypothetical protein WCG07_03325 [Candidatus Taylorbacteria bacterium]
MDMQFDTGSNYQGRSSSAQSDSAMVNFLINKGIAKTEGQANAILIAFIILGFGITIYTIFFR